jgi:hypothetical protein
VPRLYSDTEISGSLIILQYVQIRSLVLIPLLKAATCRHVDQTISSSTGDALRFEPLGSTLFRDSRWTFLFLGFAADCLIEMSQQFTELFEVDCSTNPPNYRYHLGLQFRQSSQS